jgi:hypothetical protein
MNWGLDDSLCLSALNEKTPEDKKKFGIQANTRDRVNIPLGRRAGNLNSSNNFNTSTVNSRTAGGGDSMVHIAANSVKVLNL